MKNVILLISAFVVLNVADTIYDTTDSSVDDTCYNIFTPVINLMSDNLKNSTQSCVFNADKKKLREIAGTRRTFFKMFADMKEFKIFLENCSTIPDTLSYSECLSDHIKISKEKLKSNFQLFDSSSTMAKQIDDEKETCLKNAINKNKDRSLNAFTKLQQCMLRSVSQISEPHIHNHERDQYGNRRY